MNFNAADFGASLEIMWKGMLGLFGVCAFTMLLIMGISRLLGVKKKQER